MAKASKKSARRRTVAPPSAPQPVKVDDLNLDHINPRLAAMDFTVDDQLPILRALWRELAVNEIADSIAASGYWPHEVLFVAKEGGKWVVIEGNRRLVAVKLLRSPKLCKQVGAVGVPRLTMAQRKKLDTLPVVPCTRKTIWEYVGFKHVNGPKDWDSIAKAQYVARVYNDYGISLQEIAKTIGDRHDTVRRMYRGLMVLQQAEDVGLYDRKTHWGARFAYSHLWTGLGYKPVQKFLGFGRDHGFKPDPVPKKNHAKLGELCLWLYGDKPQGIRPLIKSQNPDLRNLVTVLESQKGIAALRAGLPLSLSLEITKGDEALLRESLVTAETALRKARGYIPTGFDGKSDDIYETAEAVSTLAQSVEMDILALRTKSRQKTKSPRKKG